VWQEPFFGYSGIELYRAVDLYFGPKAPAGKEGNWVQTWPDKGWSVILRLYGPEEAFFDKTWKPSEIEEVDLPASGGRALQ
jgi:hypothetical protein